MIVSFPKKIVLGEKPIISMVDLNFQFVRMQGKLKVIINPLTLNTKKDSNVPKTEPQVLLRSPEVHLEDIKEV